MKKNKSSVVLCLLIVLAVTVLYYSQQQGFKDFDAVKRSLTHQIENNLFQPDPEKLVSFSQAENRIDVMIDGCHVTSYHYSDLLSKPVLYPIKTMAGTVITRGDPLDINDSESKDHPHHVGLFVAYGDVNGVDFWGNRKTSPQIRHVKVDKIQAGEGQGVLEVTHHWVGPDGGVLLAENRQMIFRSLKDGYVMDCTISLTAQIKVVFQDTKEGMFAIRVADWMREKGGSGRYFDAQGRETEKRIWGRRSEWVCLIAAQKNDYIGLTVKNLKESVNFPTWWHVRAYGLLAANPLGCFAFESIRNPDSASRLDRTLQKDEKLELAFRVYVLQKSHSD